MAKLPPNEVFPNPTVKQVIFQIRFPGLFYIESRLGDFQLAIMPRFPDSELRLQRAILFAHGSDPESIARQAPETEGTSKIWVFKDAAGVIIELKHDSLTILSTSHKSYATGPGSFRSVIEFVIGSLFKLVPVPVVTRLGLRYVDACPVPKYSTAGVMELYDTTLPIGRFAVESLRGEMTLRVNVVRGENRRLQYVEQLQPPEPNSEDGANLVLDFDASAEHLRPDEVLSVSDELHGIIRAEFEATIKQPVLDWMRTAEGVKP